LIRGYFDGSSSRQSLDFGAFIAAIQDGHETTEAPLPPIIDANPEPLLNARSGAP
jgi:hypothetical protein